MSQPVLVPLDGSDLAEQALPYAEALAGSFCELILLEVGEDEDSEFRLAERHGDSCAQLEAAVGDPAEQILDVAQELDPGLIVMTSRGRGAQGHSTMGRVADAVMRRSDVPVLLIRPQATNTASASPAIRRLVVPLDGSSASDTTLPIAQALATRLQLPIHLISLADTGSLTPEVASDATAEHAVDAEHVSEVVADTEGMLTRLGQRLAADGHQVSTEAVHGAPHQAIDQATQLGDIIVLPRDGHTGKQRSPLERAAEALVRDGEVPVLLVPGSPAGESGVIAPARGGK